MRTYSYVEILLRRSRLFYDYAQEALARGDYDFGVFFLEQPAQLRLKALLLRLLDFIPREHGVRELLGVIIKYLESLGKRELSSMVSEYASLWRDSLRILEDAYIGARYLAKTYERVDVEKALRAVEELFRVIEVVEHNVFS